MRDTLYKLRWDYNSGESVHGTLEKLFEEPIMNYGYLSTLRPPSKSWMSLLPKSSIAIPTKQQGDWRSNGLILTINPLPQDVIDAYELTPEKYTL
jgi:hypothetical protein